MPYNPKSLKNLANVSGSRTLKRKLRFADIAQDDLKEVESALMEIVANLSRPIRNMVFEGYFEAVKTHVAVTLEHNNEISGYPHELDPPKDHTLLDSITSSDRGDQLTITYGEGLVECKYAAIYNMPRGQWYEIYPTNGAYLKFPNRKDLPEYEEYVYAKSVVKWGQGIFDEAVEAADANLDEIMENAVVEYRETLEGTTKGVSRKGAVYRKYRGRK